MLIRLLITACHTASRPSCLAWCLLLGLIVVQGCSVRQYALNQAADTLAASGTAFASDDDPDLIRAAAPFSLKLMDSVLVDNPRHVGLLSAAARGYTQYAYAFVQQEAEALEESDIARAMQRFGRARGLYRRARDYALRGLDASHPGFIQDLRTNPRAAAQSAVRADVPLLYWGAVSWAGSIALSKDDPQAVAEVPLMEALIDRALHLDESWDEGAIHVFLISYEPLRQGAPGEAAARARRHFARALELSRGTRADPYVALAEAVAVPRQDVKEFERLLKQALAVDIDAALQHRLANLIMQRRARWLLAHTEQLIAQ